MNEIIKSAIDRIKLKGEEIWVRYSFWTKAKDVELESGENVENKLTSVDATLSNHVSDKSNPHETTKEQVGLSYVDNTSDVEKPVSTLQRAAIDETYQQSNLYTDTKIAELINGAPTTLDTLKEIADAMTNNQTVVEALEASIGSKADQAELDGHINNSTIHITADERAKWNNQSHCSEIIGTTNNSDIIWSYPNLTTNTIELELGTDTTLKSAINDSTGKISQAVISLNSDLANKASSNHIHAISEITGLQTTLNSLTSRGGYSWLAGLYDGTDEVTKSVVCTTIGNYRYLVFVLQYEDVRIDVKTIPRAFFVNEVTKLAWALLLKSGNSEAAALVWWDSDSSSIFAFINKSYNVVNVYGIL